MLRLSTVDSFKSTGTSINGALSISMQTITQHKEKNVKYLLSALQYLMISVELSFYLRRMLATDMRFVVQKLSKKGDNSHVFQRRIEAY